MNVTSYKPGLINTAFYAATPVRRLARMTAAGDDARKKSDIIPGICLLISTKCIVYRLYQHATYSSSSSSPPPRLLRRLFVRLYQTWPYIYIYIYECMMGDTYYLSLFSWGDKHTGKDFHCLMLSDNTARIRPRGPEGGTIIVLSVGSGMFKVHCYPTQKNCNNNNSSSVEGRSPLQAFFLFFPRPCVISSLLSV